MSYYNSWYFSRSVEEKTKRRFKCTKTLLPPNEGVNLEKESLMKDKEKWNPRKGLRRITRNENKKVEMVEKNSREVSMQDTV